MEWNRLEVTVFGADRNPAVRVVAAPEAAAAERAGPASFAVADAGPSWAVGRAFGLLRANRERPYYDEKVDGAARSAYYAGIPEDAGEQDRFRELSRLLSRTHTTVLSYSAARYEHLYVWVDLQENGMLRSIYTGDEYPPEKVIQEDFALEAERVSRLRSWMASSAGPAEGLTLSDMEARLAELEEEGPYNCEHVVPQSWFKPRSLPMKSDLHHLFTCDTRCNSFRGSTPFGSTGAAGERCGRRAGNEFEPALGKGPAARATLYFLLRYPGEINDRVNEYTADDIATLRQWHREDPVSLFERHRNAGVQGAQGNRNPLIDFPEWADRIDFRLGLG